MGVQGAVNVLLRNMIAGDASSSSSSRSSSSMAARKAPPPLPLSDARPKSSGHPSIASAASSQSSRSSSVCGGDDDAQSGHSMDDTGTDASSSARDLSSRLSAAGVEANVVVHDAAMAGMRENTDENDML